MVEINICEYPEGIEFLKYFPLNVTVTVPKLIDKHGYISVAFSILICLKILPI